MGLQAIVQKYCTVMPLLWWRKKTNSTSGRPQYETNPTEVTCRWDNKQIQLTVEGNRSITSNAMIMTPYEIPVGSWVFQGTIADWKALRGTYPNVPSPAQGGYEIVAAGHNPDFHGNDLLWTYFV